MTHELPNIAEFFDELDMSGMSGLVESLLKRYDPHDLNNALDSLKGQEKFVTYQNDPVGFGEQVLGEQFSQDIKTMMESVRDNVITVAKSANATGKSHGAARVGLWFFKCFPGSQVYTAAAPPERNLRKILWGEIGSLALKHQRSLLMGHKITGLNIERSPLEFLTGVSIPATGTEADREAKFSGKHAPYLLFIIDEGDAVPDDVYRGIESCMSGGFVRLLIMFNPRAQRGAPWRMEKARLANIVTMSAFTHPNVVSGDDVIPGAVTRDVTVRRINQWCRPLVKGEEYSETTCFELPSFLVGAMAPRPDAKGEFFPPLPAGIYRIEEPTFSYMVLARYPAEAEGQLISMEWINAARARYDVYVAEHGVVPPVGTLGVMGLDVAEEGKDANALCCRYGGFVPPLETWGGVDPVVSGERAGHKMVALGNISRINIDAIGVGSGSVAAANRVEGAVAHAVKVSKSPTTSTELGDFGTLRDQLWWMTREWLRTSNSAMLPPDPELIEDLHIMTYSTDTGKVKVKSKKEVRKEIHRSTNKGDSLCATHAPTGFFDGLV